MARLVYKGNINGNDVIYKERRFHGAFDRFEGDFVQNIMEVIAENGKKFTFRAYSRCIFITSLLEEGKDYQPDFLNRIIIEEKGKKTLEYTVRNAGDQTVEGMRIKTIFEKANVLYNEIRQEIMNELKEKYSKKEPKPKPKKEPKRIILSEEEEKKIFEEANSLFDTGTKYTCFYKDDTKQFIKLFSKIGKDKKKELLNIIFNCSYENKEVIEWLNKNEQDLLREVGLNG